MTNYPSVARPDLEGQQHVFKHLSRPAQGVSGSPVSALTVSDQRDVRAMIVRNCSGITLLPGALVQWATGATLGTAPCRGKRVSGYTSTLMTEVAGVVDDMLPSSGVPDGDLFWLIVAGPCLVLTPVYSAWTAVPITEGDSVYAITASASTNSTTNAGAMTSIGSLGLAFASTAATAATTNMYLAAVNQIGRAMTTVTSANAVTSATTISATAISSLLVDLNIRP